MKVIFTYAIEDNSESLRLLMPESSEQEELFFFLGSPFLNRIRKGTGGDESILDEKSRFQSSNTTRPVAQKSFVKLTNSGSAVSKSFSSA